MRGRTREENSIVILHRPAPHRTFDIMGSTEYETCGKAIRRGRKTRAEITLHSRFGILCSYAFFLNV